MFLFGSEERDLQTLILDQKYLGISWSVLANAPPTIKTLILGQKYLGISWSVLGNTPPPIDGNVQPIVADCRQAFSTDVL